MAVDMSLDERGLNEIIKAVGPKYEPATLDRSALRRAIDESNKTTEKISRDRHGARSRKRLKRLRQVRETAEQLASLLETKDDASEMIEKLYGEWPLTMVIRLAAYVEALEEVLGDPPRGPTVNEWLAGVDLPCIFKEHFHRKPGSSWNNAKADGPCVRFIASAMRELGKPYSRASIIRAMTRFRTLRNRRSLVRQSNVT